MTTTCKRADANFCCNTVIAVLALALLHDPVQAQQLDQERATARAKTISRADPLMSHC
jgi:hypothetical protein